MTFSIKSVIILDLDQMAVALACSITAGSNSALTSGLDSRMIENTPSTVPNGKEEQESPDMTMQKI